MRNFTFVLALLAFGAAAFAFLVARDAARAARDRGDLDTSFEQRIAALEQAGRDRAPAPPGPVASPPLGGVAAGSPSPATAGGAELAGGARPVSPVELERRLADLEKRLPTAAGGVESTTPVAIDVPGLAGDTTWVGSIDDAARTFELSGGQKAEMERILADARRDVDDLRKLPDETGTTWAAVEKDVVKMENGALHFDNGKLAAFREKVIPGRSESFGGAMRRIREDAAKRLKDTLTPAQRERWDKAQTAGLLPGSDDAGFGFMTFGATIAVPDPAAGMDDK
ncbi:MAG: hypothetical protein JNM10_05270 [Planctomycetia bacterium]|nr:hypothetical protein [Planctomycetia bacterium]